MPRILVVDDNPELLALLSSSFEEAGYTVQTAHRGRAAIELAKRERPDLAVIDVLLPDVMGFEVGEVLQRQKIPIIFMSGVHKGGKAAANAVARSGAIGYFEKPFDCKSLLAMVEKQVPVTSGRPKPAWDVESAEGVDGPADAMELTGRIDSDLGRDPGQHQGRAAQPARGPADHAGAAGAHAASAEPAAARARARRLHRRADHPARRDPGAAQLRD